MNDRGFLDDVLARLEKEKISFRLKDLAMCHAALSNLLRAWKTGCPKCHHAKYHVHRIKPVYSFQCASCGAVFGVWHGTPIKGSHRSGIEIVYLLRRMSDGASNAQIARELCCDRKQLGKLRAKLSSVDMNEVRRLLFKPRFNVMCTELAELFENLKSRKALPDEGEGSR